MCDFYWKRMENNNQGDLADIVRGPSERGGATASNIPIADLQQLGPDPTPFPPMTHSPVDDFGDPFSSLRDPLLHELVGTPFFDTPDAGIAGAEATGLGGGAELAVEKILSGEMNRPYNIFSRMLQISPGATKPPPAVAGEMMKVSGSCSEGCSDDRSSGGVQIASSRTPGIKRRKSQAKKVVCIPAPAAASSRPGGEVVPSDLWAWRKYGQKPIKGSPFPRGYYRCSSSKGCLARKQVERSRTDPNMLVITYTSEHNHPWPTQRNALAGSTRSQPAKNQSSASKASPYNQRPPTSLKEEPKETTSSTTPLVKEEASEMEKSIDIVGSHEFDQVFHQSYKPMIPDSNHPDDFFADLAELEPDPLSLIFSKGFMGDKADEERESKPLEPFNMFDWGAGSSSGEEPDLWIRGKGKRLVVVDWEQYTPMEKPS